MLEKKDGEKKDLHQEIANMKAEILGLRNEKVNLIMKLSVSLGIQSDDKQVMSAANHCSYSWSIRVPVF